MFLRRLEKFYFSISNQNQPHLLNLIFRCNNCLFKTSTKMPAKKATNKRKVTVQDTDLITLKSILYIFFDTD